MKSRWFHLALGGLIAVAVVGGPAGAEGSGDRDPGGRPSLRRGVGRQGRAGAAGPSAGARVWLAALEKDPALPGDLRAHLLQRYPDLEVRAARALGQALQEHPGLLGRLARQLGSQLAEGQGELRAAARDVREAVKARYPDLREELLERLAERQAQGRTGPRSGRRAQEGARRAGGVLADYPEIPGIVRATLEEKHPGLLERAAPGLASNLPALPAPLKEAMERELPGLRAEVGRFLQARAPELLEGLRRRRSGAEG